MLKSWVSRLVGLATGILLLFANAAPAKATRPLIGVSGAMDLVRISTPRDLSDVTERGTLGIKIEAATEKKRILAQARTYVTARKNGSSKAINNFVAQCLTERLENPFCAFEAKKLSEKQNSNNDSGSSERVSIFALAKDIEAGDLSKLAAYSSAELARGVNQFVDFKPLLPLSSKVIDAKDCKSGDLAWALANKVEEYFPEQQYIDLGRKLYSKASECAGNLNAAKSRFRYSLISIWQNKCADAEPHLKALMTLADSHFASRAKYWRYHCATVTKNEALQAEMRESLWGGHLLSFQNLAVNGNDGRLQTLLAESPKPKISLRTLVRPDINSEIRAIEALVEIDEPRFASEMADRLSSRLTSTEPEVRLYVAALMNRAGQALPKFKILSSLFQDAPRMVTRETLTMLFPKWYHDQVVVRTKERDLDPFMILALIRQESAFNVRAHSSAGARGLMQVMPATARSIASVRRDRLFDAATNIRVGTKYFMHRLGQYNNDVELTLAAYNAGAGRVDRWVKRYPLENKMLFMDLVPFRETRDYISSILRNYYWYSLLYNEQRTVAAQSILKANAGMSAVLHATTSLDPQSEQKY